MGPYIWMGISHIGALASEWIGPGGLHLPEGIDHILFVVALVLASPSLKESLKGATGFTLGHSVTLALAFFGLLRLPPRWVESGIALTIAFVAAQALFNRKPRHHFAVAAVFGLVHGLGFATALQGLKLAREQMLVALGGFNVGVEIGQALIILAILPLVRGLKSDPWLGKYAFSTCSLAVMACGLYWFALRASG
jgi:hypothetical protein